MDRRSKIEGIRVIYHKNSKIDDSILADIQFISVRGAAIIKP